ncbi:MAG TPA: reverse transcriptase family protein [Bryobacteraceae bacterium]|nr:reverse transcriptase family protein [Bryobacteraceae bacterium]
MPNPQLLSAIARAFLAGEPSVEEVIVRASRALGRNWRWLRPVARRYVQRYAGQMRPRHQDVVQFLLRDFDFARACEKYPDQLQIAHQLPDQPQLMQPVAAAETWAVPVIESVGGLADWLFLNPGGLDWFADLKGLGYSQKDRPLLQHYHYRILAKPSGSMRLIEVPKPRLKELQRQILAELLEKIPPHAAAHGFRKGRSIRTFAAPHVGKRVVLRMDLQDFFPSITGARIQTLFRAAGYPEAVADRLGGICTNATPREIWNESVALWETRKLYARPHLPQGAPTSPALANLCAYRFDCRLDGLAKAAGAEYTRYADDLAFSGDEAFERRVEWFSARAAGILREEDFTVHLRKTRIMRQSVRQHLAGLVTNQRINVRRTDFDLLKAILTNCIRHGPESQNRGGHASFRSHLEGRVGFVETIHPAKGQRLRTILESIRWE